MVVKCSVFRQFAGGEDEKAVLSTMRQLATRNIGTILFYSAEQDIDRWVVVKQDGLARSVRQWVHGCLGVWDICFVSLDTQKCILVKL